MTEYQVGLELGLGLELGSFLNESGLNMINGWLGELFFLFWFYKPQDVYVYSFKLLLLLYILYIFSDWLKVLLSTLLTNGREPLSV
jgi:hypothetical protein